MLTVVESEAHEDVACSLNELAREGARRMLQSALEEESFDAFVDEFSPKYEKAVECLAKDRQRLLAFYPSREVLRNGVVGRSDGPSLSVARLARTPCQVVPELGCGLHE